MHNTDRTQQFLESGELNAEGAPQGQLEAQYEGFPQGEYYEAPYQGEFQNEYPGEYQGEYQGEYLGEHQGEYQGEYPAARDEIYGELINPVTGEVNQEEELNLAAELLAVSNEQELDRFLGKLVRGVGRGFKRFARSGLGRMIGGALKSAAKAALPMLGGAVGSLIPIPGVGTALGSAAGNLAGKALGLETEGWSNEDEQFEIARRIVRIGIESGRALDRSPESEFMNEEEIGSIVSGIASRILPAVGRAVLSGVTGQAASGGQATGGILGNLRVRSPGGWDVSLGGQAGGQATAGTAVGINTPAPNVPFQPSPPGQVLPYRPGGGGAGPGPQPRPPVTRSGRWIRRGRHLIVLNAY